jgi:membrane protein implicated in regulation of membrane protease activity
MTENPDPSRPDPQRSATGMTAAGIAAALAVIVCCTGPALLAAGALGALGGFLGNPWVIAVATAVLAAAVTIVVWRRRAGRADCCPPEATTGRRDHRDQPGAASTIPRR